MMGMDWKIKKQYILLSNLNSLIWIENMNDIENWYSRGKAESEKGIPRGERGFGITLVIINILMILYFAAHQLRSTGFFTTKFGTIEMFFLYGYSVFWIISAGLEGVLGQRFLSRIFDVFGGVLFAGICIIWLLVVFPFEFSNFADILPNSLKFVIQWISNDIARVIMVLGIIVHLGAAIYCPIAYKFVDKKRFKRKKNSN